MFKTIKFKWTNFKEKLNSWLEKEIEKEKIVKDIFYLKDTIVFTEQFFEKSNKESEAHINKASPNRLKKLNQLHKSNLELYLELLKEEINEEKERKSTTESKAQSMIGTTAFAVSFCSILIGNASNLVDHGFLGIIGKLISLTLLITPIFFMVISGILARNAVLTNFTYVSPIYSASEIIDVNSNEFLRIRIKDLIKTILSHKYLNAKKITLLKYSHVCFKLTFISFFLFVLFSLTAHEFNPNQDKSRITSLEQKLVEQKIQTKKYEEKSILLNKKVMKQQELLKNLENKIELNKKQINKINTDTELIKGEISKKNKVTKE